MNDSTAQSLGSKQDYEERMQASVSDAARYAAALQPHFEKFLRQHRSALEPILLAAVAKDKETRKQLWPAAKSAMCEVTKTDEWNAVWDTAKDLFIWHSIGLVTGGKVSFVLGFEGMVGLLLDQRDVHALEGFGCSVGIQEGVEAIWGLLLSSEPPDQMGWEVFLSVSAGLGVGAGVTASSGGLVLFLSIGEDISLSLGAGYQWTQDLRQCPG